MTRLIYSLLASCMLFLFSCNNISEKKKGELVAQKMAFEQSSKSIMNQFMSTYKEFDGKLIDPSTSYKAKSLEFSIEFLKKRSNHTVRVIDSLLTISDLQITNLSKSFDAPFISGEFYDMLADYKASVLGLDDNLKRYFTKDVIIPCLKDTVVNPEIFFDFFFKDKSKEEIQLNLTMLKNNIYLFECAISQYFSYKIPHYNDGFDSYSVIIGQSANIVKPGDSITLTSGVGAFTTKAKLTMIVNGKQYEADQSASATMKIKASLKPGKYMVPVSLFFLKYDSTKETHVFNVEYTVADSCNLK